MSAAAVSESSQGARRGRDPPFGDTPHPHAYPPIEGAPEDLDESFGSPARRGKALGYFTPVSSLKRFNYLILFPQATLGTIFLRPAPRLLLVPFFHRLVACGHST